MEFTKQEFQRLIQLVLDDVATDAERAKLAELSATHPDLVTSVADIVTMDALLKWRSGCASQELLPSSTGPLIGQGRKRNIECWSKPLWTAVLAATVLLGAGLISWMFAGRTSTDSILADIISQKGVAWDEATTALLDADKVQVGRLSSTDGEYTLQFREGPTVRIVGGASLEIKSAMLVRLDRGRATANVPQNSIGFTIESDLVDVVDQGTEFGISVDAERADVVVFDGEVDVKSNVSGSNSQKRLTQGNAVKVGREGVFGRLVDVGRDVQGRWWAAGQSGSGGHLIARVSDNIGGSSEVYSCYQTTYQGLQDDALAYSDNPNHQWNGLTSSGLPKFLRGADYVRTFNHYRYMEHFQITVELSRPANLFVFSDNRIPPPDWLTEQFEDTGVDIGLDEGPWLDVIPPQYQKLDVNEVGIGAGNSIDNIFSVWSRRCADTSPITLGSAGEWIGQEKHGRAMYGIAATPLDIAKVETEPDSPANGA